MTEIIDDLGRYAMEWIARHATALAVGNGYDAEDDEDPNWENDALVRNAIAHAHVSAGITYNYGRGFAEWLAAEKEQADLSSAPDEFKDQFNNEVGRRIAEYADANELSEDEVDDLVIDALLNGDLIVSLSDPRISGEAEPTWTAPTESWEEIAEARDYDHDVPGTETSQIFLPAKWTEAPPTMEGDDPSEQNTQLPPIPRVKPPLPSWMDDALTPFDASPPPSPLIVDLDGDGVELTTFNAATTETFFDIDGDGFSEQTAWVSDDDGLLARDINENGKIDDVTELFGSPNIDGFALLAQLDTNGDLLISNLDEAWDELVIWQDADGDAETDGGELISLATLDIVSIDLAGVLPSSSTISGNPISHTSTFKYENGSTDDIVDAWFVLDQANSFYNGEYELDLRALFLPTLRGFGEVADLHIAMSNDENLLEMVYDFTMGFSFESFADEAALDDTLSDILYEWAGVQDDTPTMYYDILDSRQKAFLEAFFGRAYPSLGNIYIQLQNQKLSWDIVLGNVKAQLLAQIGAASLFDGDVTYDPWAGEITGDTTLDQTAIDDLVDFATAGGVDTEAYWVAVARFLQFAKGGFGEFSGTEEGWLDDAIYESDPLLTWAGIADLVENDVGGLTLTGTSGNDTLNGSIGNDTLTGLAGNDTLNGGDGNDTLNGGDGDNILNPGLGGNTVLAGTGNDIYNYAGGDDFYADSASGGSDEIRLPNGIDSGDITFGATNLYDLLIFVNGLGTIQIQNQFYSSGTSAIETLRYFNNSTANLLTHSALTVYGTEEDDSLLWNYLSSSIELTLNGYGGADTIYGNDAQNVINGGEGNDYLSGYGDDDTFVASAGFDTIAEGSSTSSGDLIYIPAAYGAEDVVLYRHFSDGNDLQILIAGLGQIEVQAQFYAANWGIESIVFENSDPTINLVDASIETRGTTGGDYMTGITIGAMNDTMYGDAGNDSLIGAEGDDTYVFSLGDDLVSDYPGGTDRVLFRDDTELGDLTIYRGKSSTTSQFTSLWIERNDGSSMEIQNQYFLNSGYVDSSHPYAVETLELFGESPINLFASAFQVQGTASADFISGETSGALAADLIYANDGGDTVYGGGGNDVIYGGDGADTILGEADNDTIYGEAGNDSLQGGTGDDLYVYSAGLDSIEEIGGTDMLKITGGTTVNDISFTDYSAYHTKIVVTASSHEVSVLMLRYFNSSFHLDRISFDDGFETSLPDYASWINGTSSGETVSGTSGDDTLVAKAGNDTVNAGNGNDDAHGGSGNDTLNGGSGTDLLHGGVGDDALFGQDGLDTLLGGAGADDFIFEAASAFNNVDVIKDFVANDNDAIDISDVLDGHYNPGTDVITDFVQITTNGSNSELRIDTTGSASFGGGTLVATIQGVTGLTDEGALVTSGHLIAA